jgi:hypothetical protein
MDPRKGRRSLPLSLIFQTGGIIYFGIQRDIPSPKVRYLKLIIAEFSNKKEPGEI